MRNVVGFLASAASLSLLLCSGCTPDDAATVIGGQLEAVTGLGSSASVQVAAPSTDLSIAGGTPVEVSFNVTATVPSATIEVFFDVDQDPTNDNETFEEVGLSLGTKSALLDTSSLDAGTYSIGVLVREIGVIKAYGYAPGQITVNQAPRLTFTSPRVNKEYDRSNRINPTINVAWTVTDPDSTISTQILLDPDSSISGDEVLIRTDDSQTGGSFSFELRTSLYEAGQYSIVAVVNDGVGTTRFVAPATLTLTPRLAGDYDLRELEDPNTGTLSGAIFEGVHPGDNAGNFVDTIGDIDGDGFHDLVMLSQFAKPNFLFDNQRNGRGEAYIVYGRSSRFSGRMNLNSTGTLFRGDIFTGVASVSNATRPSRGVKSFALCSDWDFDGVREMAFGLPFVDSQSFEDISGIGLLASLDPDGYFRTGGVIVAAGSVLRPDLGFPGRQVKNMVAFGTVGHRVVSPPHLPEGHYGPKRVAPTYHLHNISTGGTATHLGCRFSSNGYGDQFGESISAYDFDGLIMTAPDRNPIVANLGSAPTADVEGAGLVSLFFVDIAGGWIPWWTTNAPQANEAAGYLGTPLYENMQIPHAGPFHYIVDDFRWFTAFSILSSDCPLSAVNDCRITVQNGQFLVECRGAPGYEVDTTDACGGGDPWEFLTSQHAPNWRNTLRIWSSTPGARLSTVDTIGDVNTDGLQDIVVGAPFIADGRGACFIILGRLRNLMWKNSLQVEEFGLASSSAGSGIERIFDGVRIIGNDGDRLGQAQADAGDFNGDGVADVVIGSPLINERAGGAAVFFGSRDLVNLTQEEIRYDRIDDLGVGVVFVGEDAGDMAGLQVCGAGDIDQDGLDDILIAAPDRDVKLDIDRDGVTEIDRKKCGVVYLIYGSSKLRGEISLADVGTENLPGAIFIGMNSQDELGAGLGEQGDRAVGMAGAGDVDGDGYNDLLMTAISASPRDSVAAGEVYIIYGN